MKEIIIVFISYFFVGNKIIIFPFKRKINMRSEPFSLANVIWKCRSLRHWSMILKYLCFERGSGLLWVFLTWRLENIYRVFARKLWVFNVTRSFLWGGSYANQYTTNTHFSFVTITRGFSQCSGCKVACLSEKLCWKSNFYLFVCFFSTSDTFSEYMEAIVHSILYMSISW